MNEADSKIPLIPVATGELIDKITILRIKFLRLKKPEAIENVNHELKTLEKILIEIPELVHSLPLISFTSELQKINTKLWDVEDALRLHEAEQRFDQKFISLARSVYQLNDQRSTLKRQINLLCGSTLMEEKSYGYTNFDD